MIQFPFVTAENVKRSEDLSIREESYGDRVFEVEAFCNLDCGSSGGQVSIL
jgi:hypothetical protein